MRGVDTDEIYGEDRRQQRKRVRAISAALLVVLALGLIAAVLGVLFRERASVADSRRLAAQASAILERDPGGALEIAVDARHRSNTREARRAIDEALLRDHRTGSLVIGSPVEAVERLGGGTEVTAVSRDGSVVRWDGRDTTETAHRHRGVVTAVAVPSSGNVMVVGTDVGEASLIRTDGSLAQTTLPAGVVDLAVLPSGERVLATLESGESWLLRPMAGRLAGSAIRVPRPQGRSCLERRRRWVSARSRERPPDET